MTTITKFVAIAITTCTLALTGATYALAADTKPKMVPVATCADGGTYSNLTGEHRGACSGHGGVVAWADGSPVKSHAPKSSYTPAAKKGK
jgi:hypothetical protein